jgi:hypothetical protein
MVEELLAIFAAYGIGIGLVHLFRWRCHWGRRESSHAVIVTRDVGLTVEWHLRTFAFMQWLKASHTKITIVDEGSTDDTVHIVERFVASAQADWEVVPAASAAEAERWLDRAEQVDELLILRGPKDAMRAVLLP